MSKQQVSSLYSLEDFRPYVALWAQAKGRGEYRKIAVELGMHTTLVSQILNGRKCFTEEQAAKLCSYMNLNSLESDYFLKLVQIERAGTEQLKRIYKRQLEQIRLQANEIRSRVPEAKGLNEQDRATFYSSWQYAVVRLLTMIDEFQSAAEIASRLSISVSRAEQILDFLVSRGLCTEAKGQYKRTEKNTHVEAGSPLAIRHHQNWRSRSLALLEKISGEELAFSAPMCIAKKDAQKIRSILVDAVSEVGKAVSSSEPEELYYVGIDFLKI